MASSSTKYYYRRDVNVANFVSKELEFGEKSNNYIPWKEQMLCLLEIHELIGFINGEVVPPEKGKVKSEDYAVWRRSDRLVKGLILGALSDQLVRKCVKYETARDVWLKLENEFARSKRKPPPPPADQDKDYYEYLELYKAALRGEWDTARGILDQDPEAAKARLVFSLETALHVAVSTGKALDFVQNLVQKMSDDELELRDRIGGNALHIAALTGNTAAARILADRLPALLYVPTYKRGRFPIHIAARAAHKDTLEELISLTRDDLDPNPYADSDGVLLLCYIIDADFFDIALHLVDKYPHLARKKHEESGNSALLRLSKRDLAFPSGARFNLWERLIYYSIGLLERESEATPQHSLLLDKLRKWYRILIQKLQFSLLLAINNLVPYGRRTYAKKLMHQQAIKLVKCLCKNMVSLTDVEATSIYASAMINAARLGIHEIVEEIVETFPDAVCCKGDGHFFYQVAATNRCEKVFNLIYQTRDQRHRYSDIRDSSGNTILHLVAQLAPPNKLNLVSGAALQMQRELQWFKEVENFVHPYAREVVNDDDKTPTMLFTEEHKSLKVDGEKWMKDTASSCIIAATLIATVVFAAGITVPGGNNSNTGYPQLKTSNAFVVFAISDAVSLFTSITSLLMFLSIMTSRYAEEDFLFALPNRLCIGLFTLFISIFSMMVAFSASTYLVLGQQHTWVLIAVVALSALSIGPFVLLQFPLLWDVIPSTYGRGIFVKQTHHSPFY